jgi:hypothetical protein
LRSAVIVVETINAQDLDVIRQQRFSEMRADEPSTTRYERPMTRGGAVASEHVLAN